MITATPKMMNKTAGTISAKPDRGFSIIPLHVSAIGHIGIGIGSAIASSVDFRTSTEGR